MAAAASAGLHKLGLGRIVAENAAAEAREVTSNPALEIILSARADKFAADLQAVLDALEPAVHAVVVTDEIMVPIDDTDLAAWCLQREQPRYESPPEHPRCRSWFATHAS